jgi:hypothetical protein
MTQKKPQEDYEVSMVRRRQKKLSGGSLIMDIFLFFMMIF